MVSHGSERVMGQCNHEEADTCIVVHVHHALERGAESVLVRTVDTNVVVILVRVWKGRHFSVININRICSSLGESKSRAPPAFHAFNGCDCTLQF